VNREAADSNPVAVQVPPPKEMADAIRHEVELATDAGLRYKGGGGGRGASVGAAPNASAAGGSCFTTAAPTLLLPSTVVKRSAADTSIDTSLPPQKMCKTEPHQQLSGFDFGGRDEEEGEEVLGGSGLTGSCSSEMEELEGGSLSSRQDFSLPGILSSEIPGLDELMASESKCIQIFFSSAHNLLDRILLLYPVFRIRLFSVFRIRLDPKLFGPKDPNPRLFLTKL